MSGSWNSEAARDTFHAYLCDDVSLEVVRTVAADRDWSKDKCQKGGLRSAVQTLAVTPSPHILMVDISESADPLEDIMGLAEVCEPGTLVIAVGQINDVRLYRTLLTHGIHDYLLKPLSVQQVQDALEQAQAVLSTPALNAEEDSGSHIITAVIGARGGVGASTVATSLAWLMSTDHKLSTALLDLDIHFGSGALTMDLEPGRGLTDAIENPSRIDGLFIERAMIRANDHLALLSAEAPINTPLLSDGTAFVQLEEEFRQAFQTTVIDLPRNMLINFPQLAANWNVIVLVCELTLVSARDTIRLLSWFRSQAPQARILIVANKVHPAMLEISQADFEATIETKIDFMIPYDLKAATNAAKLGRTFVDANRASKAGSVLRDISRKITWSDDGQSEQEGKASLLDKFDLKALFSKPAKKAQAAAQ